jgi:hypothetical protein
MPHGFDPSGLILSGVYLALLMLVGYAVLSTASGSERRPFMEILGFTFAAGAGCTAMVLFYSSLLGLPPGPAVEVVLAAVSIGVIGWRWSRAAILLPSVPAPLEKFGPLPFLALLGVGLIVASVSNVICKAQWPGLLDIDSFAIWMFKAKIVALQPLNPVPTSLKLPSLSYSHQDYPLLFPFLVAGLYGLLGHINDELAKILLLPMYCSLLAIIYSTARRLHSRSTAIAISAIFASSPALTGNAGVLVAETPLLLMWAATVAMLLRWIENHRRSDLLLAGIFAAFAAFTKNEGLALLPVIGAIALGVAIARRSFDRLKDWMIAATTSVALLAPWLVYRLFLPRTHEDYGTRLTHPSTLLSDLPRLTYIIPQFFGRMFDASRVGMVWYLLILCALLDFRGFIRPSVLALWILLLVQLALYTATFVVTPWEVRELLPMIAPKLLTQATPIATLLIALHLRPIRARS